MSVIEITNTNDFNTIIKDTTKSILIYFSSTWCVPCKNIFPIVTEISNNDDITVIKIDIEKTPDIPAKYRIRTVPSLVLLKEGKTIDSLLGFITKDKIETLLSKVK